MSELVKDTLAHDVVAEITSGMIVGLGTGRTAARGIRALAQRVKDEGLEIRCVPTSEASETLAKELGLEVTDFAMVEAVDFLFDGADEVDRHLNLMKGGGGAMTRERIVAWASKRCVYMVTEDKFVDRLGTNNTLAIAVLAFGLASIRAALREYGLNGVCRRSINGDLFITDNGNLILDVGLPETMDLNEIWAALNDHPGVIDHGLFLYEADEIVVEHGDGSIERLTRPDPAG
ncbi:MAG: ribose-5-phosphate isomerase RpiA [Phycisphaerales bacterium]|nr:ribose-5-phosphate isomerase RpiA [Phycisphaerales bacterium]